VWTFTGRAVPSRFWDDLDEAGFVRGVGPRAARRTLAGLERVSRRLARARARFGADAQTHAELVWAAEASAHALRRALAARRWVAWRERPASLDARARRALARELDALAAEHQRLGARLPRPWLARSRPANYEITGRRLARAIASTRRAARALRANRPPAPPAPHEGF